MTDRELLDLAAKAAGLEFDPTYKNAHGLMVVRDGAVCQSDQVLWNPLTNDGDALRLAVKLHMSVLSNEHASWVATGMHQIVRAEEHHDGADPYAATRRAIVRAAAEIGKGLK
jgi:hypothetical protein